MMLDQKRKGSKQTALVKVNFTKFCEIFMNFVKVISSVNIFCAVQVQLEITFKTVLKMFLMFNYRGVSRILSSIYDQTFKS